MKLLKTGTLLLLLICLALTFNGLISRTSSSSTAFLGRYSLSYTIILLSFAFTICFFCLLILSKWFPAFRIPPIRYVLQTDALILTIGTLYLVYFLCILGLATIWYVSSVSLWALLLLALLTLPALIIISLDVNNSILESARVFIISLGFSVLMLELMLRFALPNGIAGVRLVYGYTPFPDWQPYVGWAQPINNVWYNSSPGEFSAIPIRTNAQGLRDHPTTYEKPEDVFRILIIGDSVTEAVEVPLENTWHEVFERQVNANTNDEIEVIAVGIGGWSTDQQLLYLQHEGCRYQPDVVMLQFTTNDPRGNHYSFDRKPYFTLSDNSELQLNNFPVSQLQIERPIFDPALAHSHIARIGWQVIRLVATRYTQDHTQTTIQFETVTSEVAVDMDVEASYWTLTEALIEEFHTQVIACDAQMIGFSDPALDRLHKSPEIAAVQEFHATTFYQVLDELGILHPDWDQTTEPFEQYVNTGNSIWDLTYQRASHFTPLGYEILGNNIAEWYLSEAHPQLSN